MSPPDADSGDSNDRHTFSYRSEADNQPMMAILEAVAWVKDADPLEFEPLHHTISVDELNGLFGRPDPRELYRSSSESEPTHHTVTFQYEGCSVTVTPGKIRIKGK